jgi:hypothetical protein
MLEDGPHISKVVLSHLLPGGGRLAKPHGQAAGWSGIHRLRLLLIMWMRGNQGSGQTTSNPSRLCPGSSPLSLCVKYTPVVMMILTFGQLHFVIH